MAFSDSLEANRFGRSANPIHVDIADILDDASNKRGTQVLQSLTPAQLQAVDYMMQLAWNRGYKHGYDAGYSQE